MKRLYLIIIVFFIASCIPINKLKVEITPTKNITFSNLKDMHFPRYGIGYTSDSENIYVANGANFNYPNLQSDIISYDIVRDDWDVLTTKLIAKRYSSAQKIGDKIYIFNGQNFRGEMNNHMEIYDVKSGELTFGSNNPFPVMHAGSVVWNNKIYVFGGSVDKVLYTNRLYVYDPEKDNWKRLANLPRNVHQKGAVVDGIIYVFGGYNGIRTFNDIFAYNIEKDKWYKIGEMPVKVSANGIAKHGKNIWLTGSYDDLSQIAVFNTETYEFSLVESNMEPRRHCGAAVVNNKLYVFGGNQTSRGQALASIQVADL